MNEKTELVPYQVTDGWGNILHEGVLTKEDSVVVA